MRIHLFIESSDPMVSAFTQAAERQLSEEQMLELADELHSLIRRRKWGHLQAEAHEHDRCAINS